MTPADALTAFHGGRAMLRAGYARLGIAVSEDDISRHYPRLLAAYAEGICVATRLYPGVVAAVERLRVAGYATAICTNKPSALVQPLLDHLGIGDRFALVLGGDSLPQRKPSGEPLRHIAGHFAFAPGDCLMVGDSLTDYRAAEDAGMPIALVRYGYPRGLDLETAHAVAVIDDLLFVFDLPPLD